MRHLVDRILLKNMLFVIVLNTFLINKRPNAKYSVPRKCLPSFNVLLKRRKKYILHGTNFFVVKQRNHDILIFA